MSAGRVAKLEALLQRIQHNRAASPAPQARSTNPFGVARPAQEDLVRARAKLAPVARPEADDFESNTYVGVGPMAAQLLAAGAQKPVAPTPTISRPDSGELEIEHTYRGPGPSFLRTPSSPLARDGDSGELESEKTYLGVGPQGAEPEAEISISEPSADDVEITFDDEGDEVSIEAEAATSSMEAEAFAAEEAFDAEEHEETYEAEEPEAPTAPVDLRAPAPEPEEEEEAPAPLQARPIPLASAPASGPVARAVSKPRRTEPATFGELLHRTLALRPR
jgi:hypothetical protein